MKKMIFPAWLVFMSVIPAFADFLVQPNDVVGICGDSITQQHLYSAYIEDYLLMCLPVQGTKVVQFGWSGEQAPGFLSRIETDIFPFKPTLVTTCYGMNDGHYAPLTDETANTYRKAQTDIIETFRKGGVRAVVLGSPKCVDSFYFKRADCTPDVYNKTLGALADIDKDIATKEGVVYADVYGISLDTMAKAKAKFGENYEIAGGDGIHPGPNGHLVMAFAFLKALGCDGNIGTITVDYSLNQATGTPGQEIVSYKDGTVDVKSTRYPFCFSGAADSKDSNGTSAIITVLPFNQDLNRYLLIVKGITTAKVKVTWGGVTKEYAAPDLAKGINLAADFLANPFVEQFNKVHAAVVLQEGQETLLSQTFLHDLTTWKQNYFPGVDGAFDQIIRAGMAQHNTLYQAASNLVIPIEHTIKIEPTL